MGQHNITGKMMGEPYYYYNLDGIPCRIEVRGEDYGAAEIYKRGEGFLPGPKSDIIWNGRPIKKSEFDAMIMASIKKNNPENGA